MTTTFDSTELRQNLRQNVPPNMRKPYAQLVAAGMKFMFDKTTHKYMLEQIDAEGPIDEKLAKGVGNLIRMLHSQSKGAFPEHLIIPVGIELMMHAADYAAQTGRDVVTPELMGSAIQLFVFDFFGEAGVKQDMLMGSIEKMKELNGAQQPGGQPPEQPGGQPPPAEPGLIGAPA